ncbi:nuclear transcription factor Y, beta [Puccinia graminis f. sp. tritici CRL 75-36-700-3]|uniref:Nuclear transcription factor Y, beta n=1 Tax=Puccinia graminis f. sp. tritici (strain CRL 75-36-700-3 / race SCCL) TaxID=418459 RepID=E3JRN6_PUCGT|nr:nuclear transcription factor Y, beta [Puccinia graminis f. sp. tritici CRL 75-36-700-3]EFP74775.2 nuclear transcription factor Y, beta [Puccinia graminis f. sp. tritici CRL 75-36-700-3]
MSQKLLANTSDARMEDGETIFPTTASLSVIAPHPTATTTTEAGGSGNADHAGRGSAPIKETEVDRFNPQHLLLPLSNISKLMKASVPLDSKISNPSKLLIQACVSEFISFLTSDANEQVLAEKRRTLNGVDLICAVRRLGFEGYYEALQIYLAKYRTVANETGKRHRRPRADDDQEEPEDMPNTRPAKRAKVRPARPIDQAQPAHLGRQDDDEAEEDDDEDDESDKAK